MFAAVEQISGTAAGGAGESRPVEGQPAGAGPPPRDEQQSFLSRGRARRRARFLRKARELAYRDLGGLVFNLHRFGQRNDALVLAKLTTLEHIDGELRAIERAIGEHEPLTVLREAGITACPRCAAIHSSEDRFCPNCGLALGPHAEIPADLRTSAAASAPAPASDFVPPTPPPAPAQATAAPSPPEPEPEPEPEPAAAAEPAPVPADAAQTPEPAAASERAAGRGQAMQEAEPDAEATVIVRPSAPGP
jgi:hypothetical protein